MKGWRNARKESSEWESLPVRGEQNVCATRWLCYGKGTRVARSIETGNLIGDGIRTGAFVPNEEVCWIYLVGGKAIGGLMPSSSGLGPGISLVFWATAMSHASPRF